MGERTHIVDDPNSEEQEKCVKWPMFTSFRKKAKHFFLVTALIGRLLISHAAGAISMTDRDREPQRNLSRSNVTLGMPTEEKKNAFCEIRIAAAWLAARTCQLPKFLRFPEKCGRRKLIFDYVF